jgi:hypothetical protein
MKLYVANVSRFRSTFQYRPLESTRRSENMEVRQGGVRQVTILPKQCVALPEMDKKEIIFVVDQAKLSGAIMVEEMKRVPTQPAVFLLSIDSAIGPTVMNDLSKNNTVIKTKEGDERRRLAAVGVNNIVEQHIDQLKTVEVELEQMKPFVETDQGTEGKDLRVGLHVDRGTSPSGAGGNRGNNNKRRGR